MVTGALIQWVTVVLASRTDRTYITGINGYM
jgi:hypothetical protein